MRQYGNPMDLLAWAIQTGRVTFKHNDYATWMQRFCGAGGNEWCEWAASAGVMPPDPVVTARTHRYVRLLLDSWNHGAPAALVEIGGLNSSTLTATSPDNNLGGIRPASGAVDGDAGTWWQVADDAGATSSPSAVATVGIATADSTPASRATNGNNSDFWQCFNGNHGGTVTLNIRRQNAATPCGGAALQWYPGSAPDGLTDGWFFPLAYHVDSSPDGATWTTRATVSGRPRDVTGTHDDLTWTPTDDTWWRLVVTDFQLNTQLAGSFGQVALVEYTPVQSPITRAPSLVIDRGANASGGFTDLATTWFNQSFAAIDWRWQVSVDAINWATVARRVGNAAAAVSDSVRPFV